jgi:hypothetical protein
LPTPFGINWRGQPLRFWTEQLADIHGDLTTSTRFQICQLAMNVFRTSEQKFFEMFDEFERAQILATYRTEIDIEIAKDKFPIPTRPPKRRKGKR